MLPNDTTREKPEPKLYMIRAQSVDVCVCARARLCVCRKGDANILMEVTLVVCFLPYPGLYLEVFYQKKVFL